MTQRGPHVQRYGFKEERKEETREDPEGKAGSQDREEENQVNDVKSAAADLGSAVAGGSR